MKWSDALTATREDLEAIWESWETTAGEVAGQAQRRLEDARDRVRRMLDALDNDPDDIE